MRILVINWQDRENPNAGGAEIHLHEIFGRLAARGHAVDLLVSGWPEAPPNVELDGIRVHRVGARWTFPLHARRGFRRIEGNSADVVVEDVNKLPLFTPAWVKPPVVGLVPHLFGLTAFRQAIPPVAATVWAAELGMPRAYRDVPFLVISDSTAADLERRGFDRARIHVSPPGIDHRFFRPATHPERFTEPTLVYVGRLRRYKGLDGPIRALSLLADRGRDVPRLLVAGRGNDQPRLEALVKELGLRDHVRFLGYVTEEEKRELLRRAWANVYPSPKEGWGITNVEAAACGTPSIASDAPGLRESVRDGESGFLVPHHDVDSWADRIDRLCTNDALRTRLGRGAIAHAAHFTWERAADDVEALLASVVPSEQ